MSKSMTLTPLATRPGRHPQRAAAWLLRRASWMLARLARRLAASAPVAEREPVIEFYAEAGAPEGALYVNGQLIGTLPGVTRL